ncbi:MAG: sugar ABC transporter ATP-binding protein [Deltaproteobacteria bacterium]|nr:MAG: sugar ABC transporter ATP-binding protein [Deltaproteobacteria bacterium]
MNDPVLIVDDVTKTYPVYGHLVGSLKHFLFHASKSLRSFRKSTFEALRNISFEVSKGEALGVIGKNGAGKSTLLGLIAGVLRPTKGKVTVNARVSPLLELGGGFHPDLTGEENILLNGVLLGMTKSEVMAKADRIAEFSELGDFIEQPIRTYSSGMLARLGFSIIAHLDPELLLIDEVLAVGDKDFQKKCISKIMEFKRNGVTIIFVSHSMPDVAKLCDRVIWIENHSIKQVGEPREVINKYLSYEK